MIDESAFRVTDPGDTAVRALVAKAVVPADAVDWEWRRVSAPNRVTPTLTALCPGPRHPDPRELVHAIPLQPLLMTDGLMPRLVYAGHCPACRLVLWASVTHGPLSTPPGGRS